MDDEDDSPSTVPELSHDQPPPVAPERTPGPLEELKPASFARRVPSDHPRYAIAPTLAVASLILGLASFPLLNTGFGLPAAVAAIVLGSLAMRRPGYRWIALAGMLAGTLVVLFVVGLGVLLLIWANVTRTDVEVTPTL